MARIAESMTTTPVVRLLLIVLLALGASCFNPSFSDCVLTCGERDQCPASMMCDHGRCRSQEAPACPNPDADAGEVNDRDADGSADEPDREAFDGDPPDVDAGDGPDADALGGGGPDGPLACRASATQSCAKSPAACDEVFCGSPLWHDSSVVLTKIPFRIDDPEGRFGDVYEAAIRETAARWTDATEGVAHFEECFNCTGRFLTIHPGEGDGVENPESLGEQRLPLPVSPTAKPDNQPPLHTIGHQLGHAFGLAHTFQRPDRDRFVSFDPAVWCASGGPPPKCKVDVVPEPGSPPFASGTFGVFDAQSKMNGLRPEGVCSLDGGDGPDPSSGGPTLGDISAVQELLMSNGYKWAPFQPVSQARTIQTAADYALLPGISPVGAPALAESATDRVEIFTLGSDGHLYTTRSLFQSGQWIGWADWHDLGSGFDSDPAVTFVDGDLLGVAIRSDMDEQIMLGTRPGQSGVTWSSLGAPEAGAASAPAIASTGKLLSVFVRGSDGLLYQRSCAKSGAPIVIDCSGAGNASKWQLLGEPSDQPHIIGKPAAASPEDGVFAVVAMGADGILWMRAMFGGTWGMWTHVPDMQTSNQPTDADSPALASWGFGHLDIFARTRDGLLVYRNWTRVGNLTDLIPGFDSDRTLWHLGGRIASAPGAVEVIPDGARTDVVALVDDHGTPGIWWKFWDPDFKAPCKLNLRNTCGRCGCGVADGEPSCSGQ